MGYIVGDTFNLKREDVEETVVYLEDHYGDLVGDVYRRTRVSGVFTRIEEESYEDGREDYKEKIVHISTDVTVDFEGRSVTFPYVYSSSPVPTDLHVDDEMINDDLLIYLNLILELCTYRLYEDGRIGYDRLMNYRVHRWGMADESYHVDEIVSLREKLAYVFGNDLLTRLLDDSEIHFKDNGYTEFN